MGCVHDVELEQVVTQGELNSHGEVLTLRTELLAQIEYEIFMLEKEFQLFDLPIVVGLRNDVRFVASAFLLVLFVIILCDSFDWCVDLARELLGIHNA